MKVSRRAVTTAMGFAALCPLLIVFAEDQTLHTLLVALGFVGPFTIMLSTTFVERERGAWFQLLGGFLSTFGVVIVGMIAAKVWLPTFYLIPLPLLAALISAAVRWQRKSAEPSKSVEFLYSFYGLLAVTLVTGFLLFFVNEAVRG